MPTLTVLAPDSALAMDEIARQLGEDAFILSTSHRDGMIEIKATNDPLPSPPRKTAQARPAMGQTLSEATGEDAVMVLHRARTAPAMPEMRPEMRAGMTPEMFGQPQAALAERLGARLAATRMTPEAAPQAATRIVDQGLGGAAAGIAGHGNAGHGNAGRGPSVQGAVAQASVAQAPSVQAPSVQGASVHALAQAGSGHAGSAPLRLGDLEALHDEIAQIRAQLAGLGASAATAAATAAVAAAPVAAAPAPPFTPADGPAADRAHPAEAQPAPTPAADPRQDVLAAARTAGFSPALVQALSAEICDLGAAGTPAEGAAFAAAVARRIVAPDPEAILAAGMVLVIGPSGAGRTTLCAKLAALAAERDPARPVRLVEVALEGATLANERLRQHARLLSYAHGIDVPCDRWHQQDLTRARPPAPVAGALQIVDLPAFSDLGPEGAALIEALRARSEAYGAVQVVLALPGSLGGAAIRAHLARPEVQGAQIALTKLDEGEIMPPEISALAEAQGRIGWLSGTRALTGSISAATAGILQAYITDQLDRA